MTTKEQRAELLELAEKATPRPWKLDIKLLRDGGEIWFLLDEDGSTLVDDCGQDDGLYIAAACNLAPELAREVERLEQAAIFLVNFPISCEGCPLLPHIEYCAKRSANEGCFPRIMHWARTGELK